MPNTHPAPPEHSTQHTDLVHKCEAKIEKLLIELQNDCLDAKLETPTADGLVCTLILKALAESFYGADEENAMHQLLATFCDIERQKAAQEKAQAAEGTSSDDR